MVNKLYIDSARIIYKNFKREKGQYNREGDATFSVVLDEGEAIDLKEIGWNVKMRDREGEEPFYFLPVAARFNNYPPRIYLIQEKKKTRLDEDDVAVLDTLSFSNIDLVIRPYEYELDSGVRGIKAYLDKGFFTEDMDEFDKKYADYEEAELPFPEE